MRIRIGEYINDKKIRYADLVINTCNDIYEEIASLKSDIGILLESSNKTCTLNEFQKIGEVYLYTDNSRHKDNFMMDHPFWILIEKGGVFLNLDALNALP